MSEPKLNSMEDVANMITALKHRVLTLEAVLEFAGIHEVRKNDGTMAWGFPSNEDGTPLLKEVASIVNDPTKQAEEKVEQLQLLVSSSAFMENPNGKNP